IYVTNFISMNYGCCLNDLGGLFNSSIMRQAEICVRIDAGFDDGKISLRYLVIIIRRGFTTMNNKS
ncbi:TPA: hypothetical protein ACIJVJ_005348, partial [Raoultella planticola]